jgi:hypothetical protein
MMPSRAENGKKGVIMNPNVGSLYLLGLVVMSLLLFWLLDTVTHGGKKAK